MMISSSDELLRDGADPAVIIDQLRVIRGKRLALQDVSVRVACGTITGLLGPSGSGKTTLIRCIVGSQIIASGSVSVLGLGQPNYAIGLDTCLRTRPFTTTCG